MPIELCLTCEPNFSLSVACLLLVVLCAGNSRTVLIACISPADSNVEESINTLRYAERGRNIKNSARRNVVVSADLSASEAAALRRENQQLRLKLARMEAKSIMSAGCSIGGGISSAMVSNENIETVSRLHAQCSALLAEIDVLKGRAQGHAKEVLDASLRADKWQAKSEAIAQLAKAQGVDMSGLECGNENDESIFSQLSIQLAECREVLQEARTEAAVARATAGAIIAGNGDLNNIEECIANSDNFAPLPKDSDIQAENEHLTTELSVVSAKIERKEDMVFAAN